MALNPRGNLLVISISALLAAITLIWLDSGVISARSRVIGPDRITSFEALPDPGAELCAMPGMEATLPGAIVSIESRMPTPDGPVCATPALSA